MYILISFVNSLSALVWSLTIFVAAFSIFLFECYAVHTIAVAARDENKCIIKLAWSKFIEANDK